jgi:DNA-3-methyladenine glycosylase
VTNAGNPGLVHQSIANGKLFNRRQLPSSTHELARFLLGKQLVHHGPYGRVGGVIVEVEAYPPGDEACHCFRGRTLRNAPLFLAHGHFYMYRCYGTALMLNISAECAGIGAGVLVRALMPTLGVPIMHRNRPGVPLRDLARGPGRLCAALGLSLDLSGMPLETNGSLAIGEGSPAPRIEVSPRIGITRNPEPLWRYSIAGNAFVSGARTHRRA